MQETACGRFLHAWNPSEPRAAPPCCRARDYHGTSEQEPGTGEAHPQTTESPALRPDGSMLFATHAPDRAPSAAIATGAPPDAGRWTGQVHRPRRRVTTLIWMPGFSTVPDPKPRSTRTDPGPEGHVRRESREAGGGEGGGWAASLRPSAGVFALSEPDWSLATLRVFHSRISSPGFNASHNSRGM